MKILIDTDWFAAIQDLPPAKQKEVITAILNYPNGNSNTNLWKKTIFPNLEKGRIAYYNKIKNLNQNNPQKSRKKNTGSDIGSVPESNIDTGIREDIIKENINNNSRNIVNNLSLPTKEEVISYAREQNRFAGIGGFVCTEGQAELFYEHYKAQGWVAGNSIPIRDWKTKLRSWAKKDALNKAKNDIDDFHGI